MSDHPLLDEYRKTNEAVLLQADIVRSMREELEIAKAKLDDLRKIRNQAAANRSAAWARYRQRRDENALSFDEWTQAGEPA